MFCMLFNLKNDFFLFTLLSVFLQYQYWAHWNAEAKKKKKTHWEWNSFVDNDLLQSTLGVRSEVFIAYVLFRCHQVLLN